MIISVSGKFRSGKDTVAKMISAELMKSGYKTHRIAFADSLKQIVEILTGEIRTNLSDSKDFSYPYTDFNETQKNTYLPMWEMTLGTMLQKLGTDVMRDHFNENVWINSVLNKIVHVPANDVVIVTDTRFINEIFALKYKGCICIKVVGDPTKAAEESTRSKVHQSETDLDSYDAFDYVIKNDGTLEDLNNKIKFIVDKILTYDKFLILNE